MKIEPLRKPKGMEIAPVAGRLGVMVIGLAGAVSSTLITGIEKEKLYPGQMFGSKTQFGRIRIGRRNNIQEPLIRDFIELVQVEDIVFGGWDIRSRNVYDSAVKAGVYSKSELESVCEQLSSITPNSAVFEQDFVRQLTEWENVKTGTSKLDLHLQLMDELREFYIRERCDRLIVLCVNSTERILELSEVHMSTDAFEKGLQRSDPNISPSMVYAYSSIMSGVPFINCTPNMTNIPALINLAERRGVAICGRDLKTGQTLVKTVLASMFESRCLGLDGWYSDNILGNNDGLALHDEESFKAKEQTKTDVLVSIVRPDLNPELYEKMNDPLCNQVHIKYYPPQGDSKVGKDHINFFGFGNKKMKMKVELECEDSPLAAGLCVDLIRLVDLARRTNQGGVIEALSYYFKAPMTKQGVVAIHALFEQEIKLENWLRHIKGETLINYLGLDY